MTSLRLARAKSWLYAQLKLPRPPGFFSPRWYLEQYPDVAHAGQHAWAHFHLHGRQEGRFATEDHVALWFDEAVFERVHWAYLNDRARLQPLDRDYLVWLIARWYAMHQRWAEVLEILEDADFERDRGKQTPFCHLPALLQADALLRLGRTAASDQRLQWLESAYPDCADVFLLRANWLRAAADEASDHAAWLAHMNAWYARHDLLPLQCPEGSRLSLDTLSAAAGPAIDGPLVSVLMAAYNAEHTLPTALDSLLAQTWANLDIIVVDDVSDDQTISVVESYAALDTRVRMLRLEQPGGPYAARNHALNAARGQFITVHDADDWSHPQKIQRQMALLQQRPELKGCFSNWVRTTPELTFGGWNTPPSWLGWVHRNTSSLMCRREVFDALGYWDELRCSCDAEFVQRIQAAWGVDAVDYAQPLASLAFGRSDSGSLTRLPETHLLTKLRGLRLDYHSAHARWHAAAQSIEDLYMPQSPKIRPFPVAEAMLPPRKSNRGH